MATVWVDTDSGTWGIAERNLVIFDADANELELLDEGSDADRIAFANVKANNLEDYVVRLLT